MCSLQKQSGSNSSSLQGKKPACYHPFLTPCSATEQLVFFVSYDLVFAPDVRTNPPAGHTWSQAQCVPPGGMGGCLMCELEGAGTSCGKAWPASPVPGTHFTCLCTESPKLLSSLQIPSLNWLYRQFCEGAASELAHWLGLHRLSGAPGVQGREHSTELKICLCLCSARKIAWLR